MLIISKYRDYYDSVAFSKGIDKTIVYKRDGEQVNYSKIKTLFPTKNYSWRKDEDTIFTFIIGFCGKLYPAARVIKRDKPFNITEEIVYGYDNIVKLFNLNKKKSFYDWNWYKKFFNNLDAVLKSKQTQDIFFDFKVPCFILGYKDHQSYNTGFNLELNPELNALEFVKVIDPWTAFQEIEMFISGVIGIDKMNEPEPTDKTKIISKGFDYKTSFRKEKNKGNNKEK